MPTHEALNLSLDGGIFGCLAQEPSVPSCLEDVQFGLYARPPEGTVEPNGVRQEEITRARRQQRGRKSLREVSEEGRKVWMGEVMVTRVTRGWRA